MNNWDTFGGKPQYEQWCNAAGTLNENFYTNAECKDIYKDFVTAMLNRTNVYNGRVYKTDQTVFAWQLMNEPENEFATPGDGQALKNWISEMAAHIKATGAQQLVGTGEEGFDTTSNGYTTAAYNNQSWLWNGKKGVSFTQNTSLPNIDFGTIHLYPGHWGSSGSRTTWRLPPPQASHCSSASSAMPCTTMRDERRTSRAGSTRCCRRRRPRPAAAACTGS